MVVSHLTRRIWIKRKVQFDDIRAVLRELVRSSVATEHNVLRHRNLPIADQRSGLKFPAKPVRTAILRVHKSIDSRARQAPLRSPQHLARNQCTQEVSESRQRARWFGCICHPLRRAGMTTLAPNWSCSPSSTEPTPGNRHYSGRAMISWRQLEETMRAALRRTAVTAAAPVTIIRSHGGASHDGRCKMGRLARRWLARRWLAWRRMARRRMAERRLGLGLCAWICPWARPWRCSLLRIRWPVLWSLCLWRLRDAPAGCDQPLGSSRMEMGARLLLNISTD